MGICNKVAGMVGIIVLVELLFSDTNTLSAKIATLSGAELANELDLLAARVIGPYVVMAIILTLLAIGVLKAHLPEINPEEEETQTTAKGSLKGRDSVFGFPHLVLGVLCIFLYVGVEVIAIDTIGLYGQYQGFDLDTASRFGIYSLIALTVGYMIGIVILPKYLSQRNALVICAGLGLLFALAALVTDGWLSIGFIVLLSFAHALMWPSIWPLALEGLGRFTKIGSALLIMGVVGGALLPLVYGAMADSYNRQMAYLVTLPCYLYILYYGVSGYKAGKAKNVQLA
jgi:glucose/galactose transporter